MTSGGRYLDPALCESLASDVADTGTIAFRGPYQRDCRFDSFDSQQVRDHLGQRTCFEGVQVRRERRVAPLGWGQDDGPTAGVSGRKGEREGTPNRSEMAFMLDRSSVKTTPPNGGPP